MKTALLIGSTGLIGSYLLEELLLPDSNYRKVILLVRKKLEMTDSGLEQIKTDFDELEKYKSAIKADDVFCALGTTMKKAGSKDAFYKVDFTYVFETASIALENGASQFLMVSSLGANKSSAVFYSRVKGEIEEVISKMSYRSISIFRPSILTGSRHEFRLGEKLGIGFAKLVSPLMLGGIRKYRPIQASHVAGAMYKTAAKGLTGVNIFESDKIQEIYKSK